jgi:hypothetical protein
MTETEEKILALLQILLFSSELTIESVAKNISNLLDNKVMDSVSPNLQGRLSNIYRDIQSLDSKIELLNNEVIQSIEMGKIGIQKQKKQSKLLSRCINYILQTKQK